MYCVEVLSLISLAASKNDHATLMQPTVGDFLVVEGSSDVGVSMWDPCDPIEDEEDVLLSM
jgi:hypothetical protein